MRDRHRSGLGAACSLLAMLGCSPGRQAPIVVTLGSPTFATSGSNLFNCGTPAQPATPHSLSGTSFDCTPLSDGQGGFSPTPVTVREELGCDDGNAALLIITCSGGDAGGAALSGTATLAIDSTCSLPDGGLPQDVPSDAQTMSFTNLAPGGSQSVQLQACADYGDSCSTSQPCLFNSLSADVTVTYQSQ